MSHFVKPEKLQQAQTGKERQIGYELEFAGLDIDTVVEILVSQLGGKANNLSKAEVVVEAPLGSFKVELDWQLGKELARERQVELEGKGDDNDDDLLMEWMTTIASQVVPVEIVCPPIEFNRLGELDSVITELRKAGALGTGASPLYAFGVHINPELPDVLPNTIQRYLKAFCLSQQWLLEAHAVDLSRRITPYVDGFPQEYLDCVLAYGEDVSTAQLIDDYLLHNPTRNRALDMLPLFAHLDEDRVRNVIDDDRIKSRPTFHYRLPNCNVEQDDWFLDTSWNYWSVVEYLAQRTDELRELSEQFHPYYSQTLRFEAPPWHAKLDQIHQNLLSA